MKQNTACSSQSHVRLALITRRPYRASCMFLSHKTQNYSVKINTPCLTNATARHNLQSCCKPNTHVLTHTHTAPHTRHAIITSHHQQHPSPSPTPLQHHTTEARRPPASAPHGASASPPNPRTPVPFQTRTINSQRHKLRRCHCRTLCRQPHHHRQPWP